MTDVDICGGWSLAGSESSTSIFVGRPDRSQGWESVIQLKIDPEEAIRLLNEKVDEITAMRESQDDLGYYEVVGWCSKTWRVIDEIFGGDTIHSEEIRVVGLPVCSCDATGAIQMLLEVYQSHLRKYINEIKADS